MAIVFSLGTCVALGALHCSDATPSAPATDVARQDAEALDAPFGEDSALDAAGVDGDVGTPLPPRPFDWVQLISTGQSLSIGSQGIPVSTAPQPYQNLKLVDTSAYPNYDNDGDVLSLVPLTSPIRPRFPGAAPAGAYPDNINGETISEGLANQLSALAIGLDGRDYVSIATAVGQGGRKLEFINKQADPPYPAKPPTAAEGRLAYWASFYETHHLKSLAMAAGKRFGAGGVFLTHGESDANIPAGVTPAQVYEDGVWQLAQDYDTDLRRATGQSARVPFFTSQQAVLPDVAEAIPTTTHALWAVSVKHPGQVICVGPKYAYEYAADRLHMPAAAYERVGEKYAEVYFQTVLLGRPWRPLEPTAMTRAGRVITVTLHVPFPPLSWDTAFPPPHQAPGHPWARGMGFEVATDQTKLEIAAVTIAGTSVQITLTGDPPAGPLWVRHAIVQDVAGRQGGAPEGRHGLLRDDDPLRARDSQTLDVRMTQGSPIITATTTGAFARRTLHDRVYLPGMATDLVVVGRTADTLTLSGPVTLRSGTALATIRSDQRNYLVHFEWRLP